MSVLIEPDCGSWRKQAVELWRGYKNDEKSGNLAIRE